MALLQPDHGDPGEDRVSAGAVGGPETQLERRLIQDGAQVIATGSLICAECELPLPNRPDVAAPATLHCGWCGHSARAREFFRAGVSDAPGNAVSLVARLAG